MVPLDWMFETQPESEAPALAGRERSLFYVACSRARDELVVTWSGVPSPFLPAAMPVAIDADQSSSTTTPWRAASSARPSS
ncbi:hypothetical protein PSU4_56660 [Pseudonocardia sulfidoxydans NBRC 16205]|uniref:Uncharacterized protein n=1 Tax=Pseudonocardia sulfidoxydans NBRC 16205 TaxID=1223511 RepID=A0A511DPH2_9PSEU|nr:hypothetical protein PSU4_56660 [Pseudonocardia sulfidoxydans NBRC 16205]